MDKTTLIEILRKHQLWLDGEPGREYADLHGSNLCNSDLRNACLQFSNLNNVILLGSELCKCNLQNASLVNADLRGADLRDADLQFAKLQSANLQNSNLQNSNLCYANLRGADLRGADLRGTNLREADLRGANLCGADLRGADLYEAELSGADLTDVKVDETTKWFNLHCPTEGAYIGYKQCCDCLIVELEIPADAKRSSATSEKCRASKAKVISITNLDGSLANVEEAVSWYSCYFVYRIGETVEVPDFDENRWNECSTGIHHFMTRQEAVDYFHILVL